MNVFIYNKFEKIFYFLILLCGVVKTFIFALCFCFISPCLTMSWAFSKFFTGSQVGLVHSTHFTLYSLDFFLSWFSCWHF